MAAGKLPKPGSKHGPCVEDCAHVDCRMTKQWAAEPCVYCGELIGYDTRFCRSLVGPWGDMEQFSHAVCEELVAEADQQGCGVEMREQLRREGRLVVSRPKPR